MRATIILLSIINVFALWLSRRIKTTVLVTLLVPAFAFAQNNQKTNILFLMDASFSMRKEWDGGTKWKTAVNTLTEIVDNTAHIDNVNIGLRIKLELFVRKASPQLPIRSKNV